VSWEREAMMRDGKEKMAWMAYEQAHQSGDKEKAKELYRKWVLGNPLSLSGKSTDHIWLMEDVEGYIGIRMDCGDSGTVYVTKAQAKDLAEQLLSFLA
jgi:hypothetical protein